MIKSHKLYRLTGWQAHDWCVLKFGPAGTRWWIELHTGFDMYYFTREEDWVLFGLTWSE